MKCLFATLALALAFTAGAWAENGYRANYWVPGTATQEPFTYHTICIANSVAEVEAYIYGEDPKAVIISIEYMGVAEETTDTSYDANNPNSNAMDPPAGYVPEEPEIAEGIDHSGEPGLPVQWEEYTIQK